MAGMAEELRTHTERVKGGDNSDKTFGDVESLGAYLTEMGNFKSELIDLRNHR